MLTAFVVCTAGDPRLLAERFHFRLLAYGFENGAFWAHLEGTPDLIERWKGDADSGLLAVYAEDDPRVPAWCRHPDARPGERSAAAAV